MHHKSKRKGYIAGQKVVKRKHTTTILMSVMLLMVTLFAASCGDDNAGSNADASDSDGVAGKFVALLTSEDSTYYMKCETATEYAEDDDRLIDDQEIAQDGEKKMIASSAYNSIQFSMDGKQYYYDTANMTYSVQDSTVSEEDVNDTYVPKNGYKRTEDAKFGGESCQCDIYEKDATEDGVALINITKYYVKDGKLIGVISEQKNKTSDRLVSRVTMTVKELSEEVPAGIFELPQGYDEVAE